MNPWIGLAAMATRKDPLGTTPGSLAPDQAITIEQAVDIFTVQGSKALRREELTGSIEVGKSADFIVLDRDIFAVPAEQVAATDVLKTFFEGKVVYERKQIE